MNTWASRKAEIGGRGVREKRRNNPMHRRNYLKTRRPDGVRGLWLPNYYPRLSSSAKAARDRLINSSKPRLRAMASAV